MRAQAPQGDSIVDGAGRRVAIPRRVERVFPAGPPAAILLYVLAPDLLLGWPRANPPDEREFLLPDVGSRPELGRIAGRGGSANLEAVVAMKPDLIVDTGSTRASFVDLAERVQSRTGRAGDRAGRLDQRRDPRVHRRAQRRCRSEGRRPRDRVDRAGAALGSGGHRDDRSITRTFFKRWYHVEPSDSQLARVLAGS